MPESRRTRSDTFGALSAGALVLAFCLILLRHDPLVFWNDDYELSILPVFADVARSWSQGEWPLLSPYSWVCGNLAGEYQYGTFSIFVNAAVVLIWKFPLTFPQQAAALSRSALRLTAGSFAGAPPIGSVRLAHSRGCPGRGGGWNGRLIRGAADGDFFGRRRLSIWSLPAAFPTPS
jgi:hypothetical protein